jgi:hypothetical protein
VYSQSQIKPPYTTQYSVFTLYYINLHNTFRPLMVAILRCNYNHIQRLSLLPMDPFESGLIFNNIYQKTLYSLLLSNNLQNTVLCLTRVTSNTYSLLDVMIKNKNYYHSTTRVTEMGFSDHFTVIINIRVHSSSICSKYVETRIFSKLNITNFKDKLEIESWDEGFLHSNANSAYYVF